MVFIEVLRCLTRSAVAAGLLVCFSCTAYREYAFEAAVPAAHTLESGRKIGFLDRQSYKPARDTLVLLNRMELGVGSGEMSTVFRNGFFTRYAEIYPLDTLPFPVADEMKQLDQDTAEAVLSPSAVMHICRENGWDYLLSWESFYYTLNLAKNSIDGHLLVRLYAGKDGEPLASGQLQEDFADCFYGAVWEDFDFHNMREMTATCMEGKMWDKGYWYAQEWVPGWRRIERRIYVAPKIVGVGELYYRQGNKERAYQIWQAAASGEPKMALRACLNLALLYEWEENFEESLLWLKKGQEVAEEAAPGDAAYLKSYIREIEERFKNRSLLEEQLF
jgi:tetratricopeptide (TPR) repeat protein